jgi:hypothetical protein
VIRKRVRTEQLLRTSVPSRSEFVVSSESQELGTDVIRAIRPAVSSFRHKSGSSLQFTSPSAPILFRLFGSGGSNNTERRGFERFMATTAQKWRGGLRTDPYFHLAQKMTAVDADSRSPIAANGF